MDKLAQSFVPSSRIDLAREADFTLGALTVRPSRREVEARGERHVLQRRVMQVLVALAHSANVVVSPHELILRCWGGLSVSDDAIGRCIAQLRRLAASWVEPPFEIETIAGVGYRLEPSGDAKAASLESVLARRGWPPASLSTALALMALALVLVAAGYLKWGRSSEASHPVPFPTVQMTEFQPVDGSREARAFADNLTGAVTDALSRYNLVVVRSSPTPGTQKPFGESPSGVDFILSGRVFQRGDTLTLSAEVSDARHNIVVYSFEADRPATTNGDMAAVVASRVAHSLDPSKLTNDMAGKLSPTDYTLIARANEAIDRGDMADALGQVTELSDRHPDDGDLQAGLAIGSVYAAEAAPPGDRAPLVQRARDAVARAEKLSPKSALLCIAQQLLVNGPLSYIQQERQLRKAAQLDPNLHVTFNALGELMLTVGRDQEGTRLITRSIQLDPMSKVVVGSGARDFVEAGSKDEAFDALRRFETIWPDDPDGARYLSHLIALYLGAPDDVLKVVMEAPRGASTSFGIPKVQADAMLGALVTRDPATIRAMVAQCLANYGHSDDQTADRDCLFEMVQLGKLDDAFRFARLAYPDNRRLYSPVADDWLLKPPLGLDPSWLFTTRMRPFRDDPRFWDVTVRTGLAEYWRSAGVWPDFCQQQLDDCKRRATAAVERDAAREPISAG